MVSITWFKRQRFLFVPAQLIERISQHISRAGMQLSRGTIQIDTRRHLAGLGDVPKGVDCKSQGIR
ncbi:hypothetical protein [Burkholderia cenocepacia]|uniref:hypothetical protein n=1 Tax=Burkholderia cenocepacia TaxID=95486 RepID=UPI002ABE81FA|nr:hypothetical protein [Burkholderia cenocepacia]